MQLYCRMSIQSRYFCVHKCGKVVCFKKVSMLCNFCLFCCVLVFLTAQWRLRHMGSARVFNCDLYRRTRACLLCTVYLCHHPRSHLTKLLTRSLFFGPSHCSYIFVPCLSFGVHVAGDHNKTISFVVGVLSTLFAHALLGLIYQSPSCPMQLSFFET